MFDIILFTPQIPPNTGNIIRLCANTGARLHLIKPLGFSLDEKSCRRAGLDYHEMALVQQYDNLASCLDALGISIDSSRLFAITKFGTRIVHDATFAIGDIFLFGAETTGLPDSIHAAMGEKQTLSLPMLPGNRSLNLSNAVSITMYEAWRQNDFQSPEA
ncbi:MAG: tRNA (cytidine(34)-2'-O)-methyltransferase [Candidatus Puniceispirillum sp.]|jgi:tRNA (cytidine/uridine-2'-O-)-methyltransferase|uniref:tRNA (cytidine(34)-2'-O)-methyltransferase n=1 Tax=Candidatus Puniceispirillum sp. TaxID=2026719 RepID=UPI001EB3DCAA|nr:tRNA (cytidine(34)-2'-O)-methyltransferase [Candidatus Puniceispirillum sp.]MBT6416168.1 tRNA (cytidine(34)-2'-O)-methyltransferase [Candidatus Puniceispirillum sp.]MBT6565896.1 tRNA (cytidine(34)-2'-O)-methyltransferase [Candidatus Puniceispirillum sp.]